MIGKGGINHVESYPRFAAGDLHRFCSQVLQRCGVPADEADTTADVLIDTDLRGVDSHGIAHLALYVHHLDTGAYKARRSITIVHETPATALIDGGGGLGHPTGVRAMRLALDKAQQVGSATVAVRHSHHFGAAGYYAALALERDMIGVCMSNAGPGVLPTFGLQPLIGTNPIALAVPAANEPPFVLDMATSVKAYGKLEIAEREGKDIPAGWFLKADGSMGRNPKEFPHWRRSTADRRGGMLPLGGAGEDTSGYKGYGLSLGVELLTAVLAQDAPSAFMDIYPNCPEPTISHFFSAIRVDAFQPADQFKANVDRLLAKLKASPKAPGHDRIYTAGEKEAEHFRERSAHGIPLHPKVVEDLQRLAEARGVPAPTPL
jgi:LDH2 family malate/lactate/ureidoglycolate dehydrogenase